MTCAIAVVLLMALEALAQDRPTALRTAASAITHGNLNQAESSLNSLLDVNRNDPLALNLLGIVRARQNRPKEAEELFHSAVAAEPSLAGPHVNLARLYATSKPQEALHELRSAINAAPHDAEAESLLRALAKQNPGMLTDFLQVLPTDRELLYDSAAAQFRSGDYAGAESSLEALRQAHPEYGLARYLLARVYLEESKASQAEQEMRAYLANAPEDASAQYGLGYILVAEQKLPDARAAFGQSIKLQPAQSESYFQLGDVAEQDGRLEDARSYFETALKNDPTHAGALTGLGVAAYRGGDYAAAKTHLEKAIRQAPNYQKAHYYFALTLAKLGDKQGAENQFQVARSLQKPHGPSSLAGAPAQ